MTENKVFKILCSIPIILVLLYFVPFLGICVLFFRYFIYKNKRYYELPIVLIILALLLLLPLGAEKVLTLLKLEVSSIPYLPNVISSELYVKIIKYSKFLFTLGIITLIISYLVKTLYYKVSSKVSSALRSGFNTTVNEYIAKDAEIKEKNDLKIKEKQERAKTTHSIICPHCGGHNIIYEDVGKCKYCRGALSAKK